MASVGNMGASRRKAAHSAASFIKVQHSYEPRMGQIVYELQKVHKEVNKLKLILFAGGAGFGAAAVLALLAAPFTGGQSLIILVSVVFVPFFLIWQKTAEEESVEKASRLIEEFRTMVFSVNSELEDVKSACEDLRRKSVGAEALKFIGLEKDILELLAFNEKLQTPAILGRIQSLSLDYKNTLFRFLQMKTRLQQLTENTDEDEWPSSNPYW